MVRLFISINVPIEIKERLASFQRKLVDLVKGSFTSAKNMHLTLKFLGEVDEDRIEQIKHACGEAISTSGFIAEIKGTGAFPSENYIRVVWAGVGAGAELLTSLRRRLDSRLDSLGYGEDFAFLPHVTLARVKNVIYKDALKKLIENNHHTNFGKFRVEKVMLMKSELLRTGAVHTELDGFELS